MVAKKVALVLVLLVFVLVVFVLVVFVLVVFVFVLVVSIVLKCQVPSSNDLEYTVTKIFPQTIT